MSLTDEFAITPLGYRHKSLIHVVKNGDTIRKKDHKHTVVSQFGRSVSDIFRSNLPSEVLNPPTATGWVSRADWENTSGNPVSSFQTTWVVPKEPTKQSGQLVYLFNSLQDENNILQPVLQWGSTVKEASDQAAALGGPFWSITCVWAGTHSTDPFFVTERMRVNPGDVLIGKLTLLEQFGDLFNYRCEFANSQRSLLSLTAANIPEPKYCSETLEAYDIQDDSDYPNQDKTTFAAIKLQVGGQDAPLSWTPGGEFPPKIISNSPQDGEIQIFYPRGENTNTNINSNNDNGNRNINSNND